MTILFRFLLLALLGARFCIPVSAQTALFAFQGRVTSGGTNFTGQGGFKFALVTGTNTSRQATATASLTGQFVTSYTVTDGGNGYTTAPGVTVSGGGGSGATAAATVAGGVVTGINAVNAGSGYTNPPTVTMDPPPAYISYTTYWSNDGTSTNGNEPAAAVHLDVSGGLFTVVLGDPTLTNMSALDPALFTQPDLHLRVWFDDGQHGFTVLDPPLPLTAAPYAAFANAASHVLGVVPLAQLPPTVALITVPGTNNFFAGAGAGNSTLAGYGNNTALGSFAMNADTNGSFDTAVGSFALSQNASGSYNTAIGYAALSNNYSFYNTAVGFEAMANNTQGSENTAVGVNALSYNTNGSFNTAVGFTALGNNRSGFENTVVGSDGLGSNISGSGNTGVGDHVLASNINGGENSAFGLNALGSNTNGNFNVAFGSGALYGNYSGYYNAAIGDYSLEHNSVGNQNTAVGHEALFSNAGGNLNSALGSLALFYNTSGQTNTALGARALFNNGTGSGNTAVGADALPSLTTGNGNIAIGVNAGSAISTGGNNIDIGNPGFGDETGVIRIGTTQTKAVLVGIYGMTIATGGTQVYVNPSGLLGTSTSSRRFKEDIRDMDEASDVLLKLRPVTFHYKREIDSEHTPQYGLVAEDVEKVAPDLVVRDASNQVYSVRYDAVNAMLLNEFLKAHREATRQQAEILELKEHVAHLIGLLEQMPHRAGSVPTGEATSPGRTVYRSPHESGDR